MHSSRVLFAAWLLLSASRAYPAAINIANTGGAGGSAMPIGVADPNYELLLAPPGVPLTATTTSANLLWVPNQANADWISPGANGESNWSIGSYEYQTTFSLDGLDPATAILTGLWTSDNHGCIYLNGADTNECVGDGSFRYLNPFSITTGFVAGTNSLDFLVFNGSTYPNPTGLLVEISGTATAIPEPSSLLLVAIVCVAGIVIRLRRAGTQADQIGQE